MNYASTAEAAKPHNCPYCGMLHERIVCPLIKAIEYHPNGQIKRVEFKEAQPLNLNNFLFGASPLPSKENQE